MANTPVVGAVFTALCLLAASCSDDESSTTNPSAEPDAGQPEADAGPEPSPPSSGTDGTDALPPLPNDIALPIVFVHGFSGSAQQFTSQAMRFVANGYPPERLRAYEHDGAGTDFAGFVAGADAVIDEVRATFKTDKVYLIGHSRGTAVSSSYLSAPERAAKVAKYIALDGGGCTNISVPCASPAQSTNTRPGQTHPIPGQRHVEVATSKESFAIQFEFLFGMTAQVLDIVKQRKPVEISGRAVNVPANTGREGVKLSIFEVAAATGARTKSTPLATFQIGMDGDWGPVEVDPEKHYEFVLQGSDAYQHHFYEQPFLRSSKFIRLRSGPADSNARMHTNLGDKHAALTVIRMREWTPEDVLNVSTESKTGDQDARNVISAASNNRIAIYLHDDAATPGESSLALLPWFPEQAFQTGVDIYLPAGDQPDGTIKLENFPRGDTGKAQILNVPNWASTNHTITAMFSDFPHEP